MFGQSQLELRPDPGPFAELFHPATFAVPSLPSRLSVSGKGIAHLLAANLTKIRIDQEFASDNFCLSEMNREAGTR
jgi:hypothetical protein